MTDQRLEEILNATYNSHPEGKVDEIEFSLVGFINKEGSMGYNSDWQLGIARFGDIIKSLTSTKPQPRHILTVIPAADLVQPILGSEAQSNFNNVRIRMEEDSPVDIRNFCRNDKVPESAHYEIKKRINIEDFGGQYGLRLKYSTETPIKDTAITEQISAALTARATERASSRSCKNKNMYRYAQRYTITHPVPIGYDSKGTLKVDCTAVRSGVGCYFRQACLIGPSCNVTEKYEVEIELTGVTKEDLAEGTETRKVLKDYLRKILLKVHGGVAIGKHDTLLTAVQEYMKLCLRNKTQFKSSKASTPWQLKPPAATDDLSPNSMKHLSNFFIVPNINTMECNRDVKSRKILGDTKNNIVGKKSTDNFYYFTDKADGRHSILYVDATSHCFLIVKEPLIANNVSAKTYSKFNSSLAIYETDFNMPEHNGNHIRNTIFDGEYLYIQEQDKYYFLIFDILCTQSTDKEPEHIIDFTGDPDPKNTFSKRLAVFRDISYNNETFGVVAKQFEPYILPVGVSENMFKTYKTDHLAIVKTDSGEIDKIIYRNKGLKYELDGLIFQPNMDTYPVPGSRGARTWLSTLKWKPSRLLTVDLKVSEPRNGIKTKLASDIGLIKAKDGQEEDIIYAVFNAEYYDNDMLVISKFQMYAPIDKVPRSELNEPIRNGDIVECRMVINAGELHWQPIKVRYDKHSPNGYLAYKSTTDLILNPITLESLETEGAGYGSSTISVGSVNRRISNYHIALQASSILPPKNGADTITLLDLGSGDGCKSGGAWMNIKKKKPAGFRVVGIDVHGPDNFFMCRFRMQHELGFDSAEYAFYPGNFTMPLHKRQDVSDPVDAARVKELSVAPEFNIVSCVFAIHYAMSSEETFKIFLDNVSHNLKTGGLFVGSYMNKKKVLTLLDGASEVSGKNGDGETIWAITANDKLSDDVFGQMVSVQFQNLHGGNKEWLVDLGDARLKEIYYDYGLELLKETSFSDAYAIMKGKTKVADLPPEEKRWLDLHYNFVFRKVARIGFPEVKVGNFRRPPGVPTQAVSTTSKPAKPITSKPAKPITTMATSATTSAPAPAVVKPKPRSSNTPVSTTGQNKPKAKVIAKRKPPSSKD